MPTSLVLTVIGPDRTGLVESLSETLAVHGGNWEESRMARLAGQFAGILLATVSTEKASALIQDLQNMESTGLRIAVEISAEDSPTERYRTLRLELVGQDHPGIVRDISRALANHGINIDEFSSHCSSASMSAETLFPASAQRAVPANVTTDDLKTVLENIANELMVDITLDDDSA